MKTRIYLGFALLAMGTSVICAADDQAVELKNKSGCKVVVWQSAESMARHKPKSLDWNGRCKDGYLDGQGKAVVLFDSGTTITSEAVFRRGKEEGFGESTIYSKENGTIRFRGVFVDGRGNGSGQLSVSGPKGEIEYVGEFVHSKFHGKGILKHPQYVYTGDFRDSKPDGVGRFELKNGAKYEGEVKLGKPEGKGKLDYADGKSVYQGLFRNGKPDGEGVVERDGKRISVQASEGNFRPASSSSQPQTVGQGDGSPPHFACAAKGYVNGTQEYARCRYEQHQMDQAARSAYEQQRQSVEAARLKRQQELEEARLLMDISRSFSPPAPQTKSVTCIPVGFGVRCEER